MASVDVSSPAGLKSFNTHLEDRSYVTGYILTSEDFAVFSQVKEAPNAKTYPHVSRWYTHIASFTDDERLVASSSAAPAAAAAAPAPAADAAEEEDDFDCFGEETEEDVARQAEIQRIADEAKKAKEAKGKVVVEKSVVILDVKPWDSETNLDELEVLIRQIEMEGLEWKTAEKKPIAYGVNKITIMCHIVDKLVSVDDLQEKISELEDYVQSTDVAAFSKL
jgi:elongation factor 1-beta